MEFISSSLTPVFHSRLHVLHLYHGSGTVDSVLFSSGSFYVCTGGSDDDDDDYDDEDRGCSCNRGSKMLFIYLR